MSEPYYQDDLVTLLHGDALEVAKTIPSGSVQTIVTSPPYFGLRDYGADGQMGAEGTLDGYVAGMVALFSELRRTLADDGTLWLNLGDSYTASEGQRKVTDAAGSKQQTKRGSTGSPSTYIPGVAPKNLMGVPWRVALALQADGWILRSDIIWAKPNPMPESVTDRPTKSHEYLFLLAKAPRYYYDAEAIQEDANPAYASRYESGFGGTKNEHLQASGQSRIPVQGNREYTGKRNKRTVWEVATVPFPGSHFAVYPPELVRPCVLAGSRPGDTVLDPFSGSGTTGMVSTQEGRKYIGIDLNADYLDLSLKTRFAQPVLNMEGLSA
jgi:DNA modification methylase